MAKKKTHIKRQVVTPSVLALAFLSVTLSFAIGIQTAGDVQTISSIEAEDPRITGDMNADGRVDERDVIEILEVVRGYEEATPEQLLADPNGDGSLTVDDALRMLHDLSAL